MLRLAERLEVPAVATNPVRYLDPSESVPGRRARVHARARADRGDERVPSQRRRVVEAGFRDARAVRRAAGPRRRDPPDRRALHVRPRAEADPLPGLPDAGGPQRRRDARGTLLARRPRPWREGDRGAPHARASRALDDPADGLRELLPDGRRHRRRHQGDGDLRGVPGLRRGIARVLPRRRSPTWTRCGTTSRSSGSSIRCATSFPTSTSTSSRRGARTSTTWCCRGTATIEPGASR